MPAGDLTDHRGLAEALEEHADRASGKDDDADLREVSGRSRSWFLCQWMTNLVLREMHEGTFTTETQREAEKIKTNSFCFSPLPLCLCVSVVNRSLRNDSRFGGCTF